MKQENEEKDFSSVTKKLDANSLINKQENNIARNTKLDDSKEKNIGKKEKGFLEIRYFGVFLTFYIFIILFKDFFFNGHYKNGIDIFGEHLRLMSILKIFFLYMIIYLRYSLIFCSKEIVGYNTMIISDLFQYLIVEKMNLGRMSAFVYSVCIFIDIKIVTIIGHYNTIKRVNGKKSKSKKVQTKDLDWQNLKRFFFIPSLIYSPPYKQSMKIEMFRIVRFVMAGIFLIFTGVMYFNNSMILFLDEFEDTYSLKSFLNVSFSCFMLFSVFYVIVFRIILQMLAEINGFQEPLCSDWWNADTISVFWRKWNIPTHKFLKTYIYNNKRLGGRKLYRHIISFVLSGFIHDLVVFMSTKRISIVWAVSMALQVGLSIVERKIHNQMVNRIMFIIGFFLIGQPILFILMYRIYRKPVETF